MEQKMKSWEAIYAIKNGLVDNIVKEIGCRTLDVSEDNVNVFAIEHHCNEGIWGKLCTMSEDGFTLGDECDCMRLVWKDMIIEDLAMVLDYLRTGNW